MKTKDSNREGFSPAPGVRKFVDWSVEEFDPEWSVSKALAATLAGKGFYEMDERARSGMPSVLSDFVVRRGGWEFDFRNGAKEFLGKATFYDEDGFACGGGFRTFYGSSRDEVIRRLRDLEGESEIAVAWLIPMPEADWPVEAE